MIDTNYNIEALDILLDKDCLSERYYPLLPYKNILVSQFRLAGCKTKNDAAALSDDQLAQLGLQDVKIIQLLRRFLTIYDANPQKFREIEKISSNPEEQTAFRELYYLPGVKSVRASLYYRAGYKSLQDFADTTVQEVLERTALAISKYDLSCIVPLPKEVRTQIAVAKAFFK